MSSGLQTRTASGGCPTIEHGADGVLQHAVCGSDDGVFLAAPVQNKGEQGGIAVELDMAGVPVASVDCGVKLPKM